MNIKFRTIIFILLFALLFLPTGSAYAQGPGPGDGRVVFGTNVTIESDDPFEGDLVVFGGNVTIEEGAIMNGDLVVIGGRVESDGEVNGDVVNVGGQVVLNETALVTGDVVTIGGQLKREDGATIEGDVVNNVAPQIDIPNGNIPPIVPEIPGIPDMPSPNVRIDYNPMWVVAGVFSRALIFAMLAMLVVVFLQPQIERVSEAIFHQPVMSVGIGLVTAVGGPITIVVVSLMMAITLILIPVALLVVFLGALLLALVWLFGVIALGYEVGERFARSVNQTWAPVFSAGFGTFFVLLVGGALGEIPCIGWVAPAVVGLLAIGAVVITRFGGRQVPGPGMSVIPSSPDAGQAPPPAAES